LPSAWVARFAAGSASYFECHGRPSHPRDLHDHRCLNAMLATDGSLFRWIHGRRIREFPADKRQAAIKLQIK
jgi:hypothetical protein